MKNKNQTVNSNKDFLEIVLLIQIAKNKAFLAVNTSLIDLYWKIGEYISKKLENSEWGEKVVEELAEFIANKYPALKGFTRSNLYRMIQFYLTYKENQIVAPLVRQLTWTNHLLILARTKSIEEKEFYIRLSIRERYSKRELERQINLGYFERTILQPKIASPFVRQIKPKLAEMFKDTYSIDFLNLPKNYSEKDLQTALIENFKDFILEFGKDFTFAGKEYKIQVGNNDYFIDLLFYHRSLRCLVAFELKIDEFKPEFLGKMNFYLEALDRDIKKEYENPSVGIILCNSKDETVVEYALSRSLSPTMIAEYKTKLIDTKTLKKKLQELYDLTESRGNAKP